MESEKLALARSFLKKAAERNVGVLLPRDLVIAHSPDDAATKVVDAAECPADAMALDIGPETARGFADELARARTVFWNGPMGMFEKAAFADGTLAVAHAIGANRRALSVVGGGDSAAAAQLAGIIDKVSHVSTGGGAALELIEGKTLPGIAALEG